MSRTTVQTALGNRALADSSPQMDRAVVQASARPASQHLRSTSPGDPTLRRPSQLQYPEKERGVRGSEPLSFCLPFPEGTQPVAIARRIAGLLRPVMKTLPSPQT